MTYTYTWDDSIEMWVLIDNSGNNIEYNCSERFIIERMLKLNGDQQNW